MRPVTTHFVLLEFTRLGWMMFIINIHTGRRVWTL